MNSNTPKEGYNILISTVLEDAVHSKYTVFELKLAREKISSKQNKRQGEMPYKMLIDLSFFSFVAPVFIQKIFYLSFSILE